VARRVPLLPDIDKGNGGKGNGETRFGT